MQKNIDLIEKYIEFIFAQKNLAKNTVTSYEYDLSEFAKFIGHYDFLDLTINQFKKYVSYLSKNFSPSSHCRKLSSVKNFFLYLHDLKLVNNTPMDFIDFPKLPKKIPKFLSESEVNILIENNPAIIGEANQEATINPTLFHDMASAPPYAKENPIIAPIIECVVETGYLK